jgi:hypothetical protein
VNHEKDMPFFIEIIVREHFKNFAGRPAALPFIRCAALPFSCRSAVLMPLCRSAALMPFCRSYAALPQHNEFVLITF